MQRTGGPDKKELSWLFEFSATRANDPLIQKITARLVHPPVGSPNSKLTNGRSRLSGVKCVTIAPVQSFVC